jgi:hypothetical protein
VKDYQTKRAKSNVDSDAEPAVQAAKAWWCAWVNDDENIYRRISMVIQ